MLRKLAMCAAATVAVSTAVGAEEYTKYGTEGAWTIWANNTSGGCFLENRNNNGNTVQMGLRTNDDKLAFLGVWNHAQSIMEPDETRDMKLEIDGKVYTFTAKANSGPVSNGQTGGFMYFNNPDFISDIENGQVMTVKTSDSTSFQIDLMGTKKGIAMARMCFEEINS